MRQLKIDWFEMSPLKLQAVPHNTTRLKIPAFTPLFPNIIIVFNMYLMIYWRRSIMQCMLIYLASVIERLKIFCAIMLNSLSVNDGAGIDKLV